MIDHEMRKAVFLLHERGVAVRQISRQLRLARNTVREIIAHEGTMPTKLRSDRIDVEAERLRELYVKCGGWKERMYEMLRDDGVTISYPTLTQRVRELGLGSRQSRCGHVDDEPGAEMQHDTSPYNNIKIGGKATKVVGSLLYYRYSKHRYLRFYRSFTRFHMKCFLDEGLRHYGYAAGVCIIDNTNLAVAHGTGKDAVMHLEMAMFLERYGSKFEAHELGHSNRKAGNERSFWTVETNFFPGREFASFEDMNNQAFAWATVTMAGRAQTKRKIIPNVIFEEEKAYLNKVLQHLPRPYRVHENRATDQYGYTALAANYYWVPGTQRRPVRILEYADSIKIFDERREVAEYKLPPAGTKGVRLKPEGIETPDRFPNNQKQPTHGEQRELRSVGKEVADYLDFVLAQKGIRRHLFVRDLHRLSRRGNGDAFRQAIARCLNYRVTDLGAIERIFIYYLNAGNLEPIKSEIDQDYTNRDAFRAGEFSEKPDLSVYDLEND